MPEPYEFHQRRGPPPKEPSARRTLVNRVLGIVALLAASLTIGAFIGYQIGEATCHDDPYAILRCLGNDVFGLMIGSIAGLTCGLIWSVVLVRKWKRRGSHTR